MPGRSLVRSYLHPIFLLSLFLLPFCLQSHAGGTSDWDYQETRSDSREFAPGGMLHIRLSVGDLHVRRGDSARITLRYTVKSHHEKNVKDVHVDFDVRGNDATLDFHAPSSNTQFDVELDVPQKTNLDVHAKVGDLTIEEVEGDKDLSLGVGDIHVRKGQSTYSLVRASTGIGDVNSGGYGETSGWLGKTLKYRGEGKYELRARVGVGDITLEDK
jgi:hypothetical protein